MRTDGVLTIAWCRIDPTVYPPAKIRGWWWLCPLSELQAQLIAAVATETQIRKMAGMYFSQAWRYLWKEWWAE